MTSRRPLYIAVPALVALALGALQLRPHDMPSRATAARPAAAPSAAAHASGRVRPGKPAQKAVQSRYHLRSEQRAFMNERESAAVTVEGTWTITPRSNNRFEVQLAATSLTALGDTPPSGMDVSEPFIVVKESGRIASLGFADATPGKARDLLSSLAATFQCAELTEDGLFTLEEEDLTGKYEATYERRGNKVTRKRDRYVAMRGPRGLEGQQGNALTPEEDSEFVFDDEGLVRATVKLTRTAIAGKGAPAIKMILRATLSREGTSEVALADGPELTAQPMTSHADHKAIQRKRLEKLVLGAKAPELIDAVRAAARLDRKEPGTDKTRALALRRVSALVQLDGSAARDVTAAIRKDLSDQGAVGLLAGALASAPTDEATGALASLVDDTLPAGVESTVIADLALTSHPTSGSAAALTRALDSKTLGDQAALALGAQAKKLGEDDATDAVQELMDRYESAASPAERQTYLQALANSGSREVLPVMLEAIHGQDFDLARLGAMGLRFIPGDDVDDTLWGLIQSGSPVIFDAIKAVAYRSTALWQPRLTEALAQFAGQKRVLEQIRAILTQWSNLAASAPQAPSN